MPFKRVPCGSREYSRTNPGASNVLCGRNVIMENKRPRRRAGFLPLTPVEQKRFGLPPSGCTCLLCWWYWCLTLLSYCCLIQPNTDNNVVKIEFEPKRKRLRFSKFLYRSRPVLVFVDIPTIDRSWKPVGITRRVAVRSDALRSWTELFIITKTFN